MPDLDGAAGDFWLPTSPNVQLHGRYHVAKSGGVEVEIFGAFAGERRDPFDGLPIANIPLMRGKVGDNLAGGTDVTLLELVTVSSSSRMRRFTANSTIEGAGFDSTDAIQLTVASIKLDWLDEWVDRRAGSRDTERFGEDDYVSVHRQTIHPDLVASVPGAEVRLRTTSTATVSQPELSFRVSSELIVSSHEPVGLDDFFFRFLRPLRDLLSVATCQVVRLQSQSIGIPGREVVPGIPTTAIVRTHRGRTPESEPRVHQPEMLVNPDLIPFPELISRWYSIEERATVALTFLLGARQSNDVLTKASNAITALESLHRALHGDGDPLPSHQARMARMQAALENRDWRWLRRFVARSHEPNLEHRLVELTDALGSCRERLVGPGNAWAREMVQIRNAVAHGLDHAITVGMDVRRTLALSHIAIAVAEGRLALALGRDEASLANDLDRRWTLWSRDVDHYSQWLPDLYL